MFTGIVQTTGRVAERSGAGPGIRLRFEASLGSLDVGESVCVSGACLTVAEPLADGFFADVSGETCDKTTLGSLEPGSEVNLERSLRAGDLLGGHILSGHVDARAHVFDVRKVGEFREVTVELVPSLRKFVAEKGSIGLDGVSLTVNRVLDEHFELMLIPHTLQVTTLSGWKPGTEVNLEVDTLARYVVRYLDLTRSPVPT